ncbi:MAG: HAD hydrolase-like protein [Lentisphaeria bacterium]|nr:HAD hydrolase-like protein [Lentisphaeria bacterium]
MEAVLLDVDGVLTLSHRALPGSRALVEWLRREGMPFVLLTNDGSNSAAEKLADLRAAGLPFEPWELISSGHALAAVVAERGWAGAAFFRMGLLGEPCYAEAAGLRVITDPERIGCCRGILIGERPYDWESAVAAALNHLPAYPDTPVVVPNPDIFFPLAEGRVHPASGAIAAFLQLLCRARGVEVEPLYLGKPFRPIFAHAQRALESRFGRAIARERMLMVGDSLSGDIAGGHAYGCRTALVLTGVTRAAQLARSKVRPDVVFEGLAV